jgi:hypothetical protein
MRKEVATILSAMSCVVSCDPRAVGDDELDKGALSFEDDDDDDDDDSGGNDTIDDDDDGNGTDDSGNDDDADTSDDNDNEDSETTDPSICKEVSINLQQDPARVMLVLDKSGSMLTKWDHDNLESTLDQSRWVSLLSVVQSITTQFDDSIDFGAQIYPSADAKAVWSTEACLVEESPEVPLAPHNGSTIMATLRSFDAAMIKGGTPTTEGMKSAIAHLDHLKMNTGETSIVLITDGSANCDQSSEACADDGESQACLDDMFEAYDENLEPSVADAFSNHGYATYVVGIDIANEFIDKPGNPKVNPYQALNDLAIAGGKPRANPYERFYNATNEDELQSALHAIAAEIRTCVVALSAPPNMPPAPNQVEFVSFRLVGEEVPFLRGATSCTGHHGWRWTDPSGPYESIEVCGSWCDILKMEAKIDGVYRCEPPQ